MRLESGGAPSEGAFYRVIAQERLHSALSLVVHGLVFSSHQIEQVEAEAVREQQRRRGASLLSCTAGQHGRWARHQEGVSASMALHLVEP